MYRIEKGNAQLEFVSIGEVLKEVRFRLSGKREFREAWYLTVDGKEAESITISSV